MCLLICLSFLLFFLYSWCIMFYSVRETSFINSFGEVLLATGFYFLVLSYLTRSLFRSVKIVFTGYRILCWQLFSFSTLKKVCHFLLASVVSVEKSTLIWIIVPLMCDFLWMLSRYYFLSLVSTTYFWCFWTWIIFVILFGACYTFWICRFMYCTKREIFSHYLFRFFLAHYAFFFPSDSLMTWMLDFLFLFYKSLNPFYLSTLLYWILSFTLSSSSLTLVFVIFIVLRAYSDLLLLIYFIF